MSDPMKRLCIIALSVFLVYAGVAWAVEICLRDGRHVGYSDTIEREHYFFDQASEDLDLSYHCFHRTFRVEQTLPRRAEIRTPLFTNGVFSPGSLAFRSSVHGSGDVGLIVRLVFRNSYSFPYLSNLPRYLLHSVFQI